MGLRHLFGALAASLVLVTVTACATPTVPSPTVGTAPPAAPPTAAPSSTVVPGASPGTRPTVGPSGSPVVLELRTFQWSRERDGVPIECDAIGIEDPVYGHLGGSLTEPGLDAVWLTAPDGERLSVLWPEGFRARFAPDLEILDETGAVFARARDAIMAQVSRSSAAGTPMDRYELSGILQAGAFTPEEPAAGVTASGCYPTIPEVGPARWWVNPNALPIPTTSRTIRAFIQEVACASGQSPEGRVLDPAIEYGDDAITVTFMVTRLPGGQDCPGNPAHPVDIRLSEPVGIRSLLDGSTTPPRDATQLP